MEGKVKVSFGIKSSKQGSLPKKAPTVSNDVEYIRSFDSTCKPRSLASEVHKGSQLVIPSQANQINLDQLSKTTKPEEKDRVTREGGGAAPSDRLGQLAAQELLKDAQNATLHGTKSVDAVLLPLDKQTDAVEATLEDYENVPVEDFGRAMLRGMGWEPGQGIGRKPQRVASSSMEPQLRPKGLGLGADRVMPHSTRQQPLGSEGQQGEEVLMAIGCGVQVVAGAHGGLYGKMVSHNEDSGRCIIKLEIGGSCVSISESLLKSVGREEYASNSRVLNASKYKMYKESSGDRPWDLGDKLAAEDTGDQRTSGERRHRSRSPHE